MLCEDAVTHGLLTITCPINCRDARLIDLMKNE